MEGEDEREAEFETRYDECSGLLKKVADREEPRRNVEESKEVLKELERLIDEAEKDGAIQEGPIAIKAKTWRKRYNELVKQVMKEDSLVPYENEAPGFKTESNLLFQERKNRLSKANSSSDEEDNPEEVADFKSNQRLVMKIVVGIAITVVIALIIFFLYKFLK